MNKNDKLAVVGEQDQGNGLYRINDVFAIQDDNAVQTTKKIIINDSKQAKLLHRRLGHLNYDSLCYLSLNGKVKGLPRINFMKVIWEQCFAKKKYCKRFPKKSTTRATRIL